MWVLSILCTLNHTPLDDNAKFVFKRGGALTNLQGAELRAENHLYDAASVAQVDEKHLTVIS